jgi:hypothetical protein
LLRHRFGDENFLLVGRHSQFLAQPLAFLVIRPSNDGAGDLV